MPQIVQSDTQYFSKDFPKELADNGKFTFDIAELNRHDRHYLFVYGTLKRSNERHILLSANTRNQFAGVGVTKKTSFDMLIAKPAGFPVILENTTNSRLAKVKGELWLVPTETIIKCDHVEQNEKYYDRVVEDIYVGTECIPAFIYVGVPLFWRDKDLADNPRMLHDGKPYHVYSEGIAKRLAS